MRLMGRVSVNWTLSNIYSKAPNLNHHMKWAKEVEQERPKALSATYRACRGVSGHLDIIGVECVENLKILFPARPISAAMMAEFSTRSLAYKSRSR